MFRYFGSKASTAATVADIALSGIRPRTACDAFGGLANIGAELKRRGCKVTACDLLASANAFQYARIHCSSVPSFQMVRDQLGIPTLVELAAILNERTAPRSWFVHEYSKVRHFFTGRNAAKIAGAWLTIAQWNRSGWLSDGERKYVVASLINCADSVANTAGTYYAYLKHWHRKALRPFKFEWFPVEHATYEGSALMGDALQCLKGKYFDLLYLDPPYNERDYSRYYHLPETLAGLRAKRIDPESTCGQPIRRSNLGPSIRAAMELSYIEELISATRWRRLVVQYAHGAHIPLRQLRRSLAHFGHITEHQVRALRYRTTTGSRAQTHYVFVVN
jgi:adenine-specific DNA-methyltransferase